LLTCRLAALCVWSRQDDSDDGSDGGGDAQRGGGSNDGDWAAPAAAGAERLPSLSVYAPPPASLVRALPVVQAYLDHPPRRLKASKATLISPDYARKRSWGAEDVRCA
jgi:hypothetical protein